MPKCAVCLDAKASKSIKLRCLTCGNSCCRNCSKLLSKCPYCRAQGEQYRKIETEETKNIRQFKTTYELIFKKNDYLQLLNYLDTCLKHAIKNNPLVFNNFRVLLGLRVERTIKKQIKVIGQKLFDILGNINYDYRIFNDNPEELEEEELKQLNNNINTFKKVVPYILNYFKFNNLKLDGLNIKPLRL